MIATLYWNWTTDRAAFAGLAVGTAVPALFVAATGTFLAAPILGLGGLA